MTDNILNKIKEIAEMNFRTFGTEGTEDPNLTVDITTLEGEEVAVTSIWYDRSGRFSLTDEQAKSEWGAEQYDLFVNTIAQHFGLIA